MCVFEGHSVVTCLFRGVVTFYSISGCVLRKLVQKKEILMWIKHSSLPITWGWRGRTWLCRPEHSVLSIVEVWSPHAASTQGDSVLILNSLICIMFFLFHRYSRRVRRYSLIWTCTLEWPLLKFLCVLLIKRQAERVKAWELNMWPSVFPNKTVSVWWSKPLFVFLQRCLNGLWAPWITEWNEVRESPRNIIRRGEQEAEVIVH